jgi:hypothetical protein
MSVPSQHFDTAGAADYVGLSESFLNKARITGNGPAFHKLGRRVVYAIADLDIWLATHKRSNTSEYVQEAAHV